MNGNPLVGLWLNVEFVARDKYNVYIESSSGAIAETHDGVSADRIGELVADIVAMYAESEEG